MILDRLLQFKGNPSLMFISYISFKNSMEHAHMLPIPSYQFAWEA